MTTWTEEHVYRWTVEGFGPLGGPHWHGWSLRGRYLVTPDRQKITPERLRGILWRQELESWRDQQRAKRTAYEGRPVRVVVVNLSEFRDLKRGAA